MLLAERVDEEEAGVESMMAEEQALRERVAYLEKELSEKRKFEESTTHKVTRKPHGLIRIRVVHRAGKGTTIEPRGASSGQRWASANRRSLAQILADVRARLPKDGGAEHVAKALALALRKRWPEHDFEVVGYEPEVVRVPCAGCVRFSTSHPAAKFPRVSALEAHGGRACEGIREIERLREVWR